MLLCKNYCYIQMNEKMELFLNLSTFTKHLLLFRNLLLFSFRPLIIHFLEEFIIVNNGRSIYLKFSYN